jgi:hypothetical protein
MIVRDQSAAVICLADIAVDRRALEPRGALDACFMDRERGSPPPGYRGSAIVSNRAPQLEQSLPNASQAMNLMHQSSLFVGRFYK